MYMYISQVRALLQLDKIDTTILSKAKDFYIIRLYYLTLKPIENGESLKYYKKTLLYRY